MSHGVKKLAGIAGGSRVVRETTEGLVQWTNTVDRTRLEILRQFHLSESPTFDRSVVTRRIVFLTDAELDGARDFRDLVVARIPHPPASYFEMFQAECEKRTPEDAAAMMATIRGQFEPEPIPYRRHQEVGMRYWLPTDVTWWATLIVQFCREPSNRWTPGRPGRGPP